MHTRIRTDIVIKFWNSFVSDVIKEPSTCVQAGGVRIYTDDIFIQQDGLLCMNLYVYSIHCTRVVMGTYRYKPLLYKNNNINNNDVHFSIMRGREHRSRRLTLLLLVLLLLLLLLLLVYARRTL